MDARENPCLTCADTCCSLKGQYGLRLSKDEFEAHFKDRGQGLLVRVENSMVILSSQEGVVCPHLENGGCQIYPDRPVDCRLFPYQMQLLYETRNKVKFLLHSQSNCPERESYLLTEAEAKALVEDFGRNVYGNKRIIVQFYDKRLLPRIKSQCELLLVKLCMKLGSALSC